MRWKLELFAGAGFVVSTLCSGCPNDDAPPADASIDAGSIDGGSVDGGACAAGSDRYALYYEDRDDDGSGNSMVSFATCTGEPPFPSWVREGGDCDDLDAERRPGIDEVCNGIDEDCDDAPDDGLTFVDYYLDDDGDSFGSGEATRACVTPGEGWAAAAGDCDETDPLVHPGATERCNGYDDDCVGGSDEGDPTLLCAAEGGTCIFGNCGCEDTEPAVGVGETCETAIDLGTLTEPLSLGVGPRMTTPLHVFPAARSVWYRFRADERGSGAETNGCDEFHVRARVSENPDDLYTLRVRRGDCGRPYGTNELNEWVTDTSYVYAEDVSITRTGSVVGQCPCGAGGRPPCLNDSATFFVEVRLRDPSHIECSAATLEVSNGFYGSEDLDDFPDCPGCR